MSVSEMDLSVEDFREKARVLRGAQTPDDVAAGGRVPLVADGGEPRVEARVLIARRADAERFEIPAILAVVLLRERGPEFGDVFRAVQARARSRGAPAGSGRG